MTRIYKQQEHRNIMPRRPKIGSTKTGPKKDNLPSGYKEHENAAGGEESKSVFIPKIA